MAMTAGSSSSHHSAGRKNLSSPWAQIVRGELEAPSDSDHPVSPMRQTSNIATIGSPVSPPLALTHDGQHAGEGFIRYDGNADSFSIKIPAWNKRSSGSGTIVEPAVMGDAFAWPPLSEAIRLSPKVQSADPPAATGSKSGFQALGAVVNSPGKPASDTNHVNLISIQDHMASSCHKLTKHGTNNSNSNASTGFVQNNSTNPAPPVVPSPPPPPFPILVGPNGFENFIPPMIDPSVNQPYKGNTWEGRPGFMHQPHAMSDHRSSSRRGNFVSRPRSYGTSHRGGHGGRHDHDRGNFRGNRDVNMSTQRTTRSDRGGFVRTPPSNVVPFFPPHGVRPFGLGPFPDFYYPGMHMEPYRAGGPFFPSAAPRPVLITLPDDLSSPILNQINYYFSDDNLLKDDYLKKQMDVEGWVHISLIANFPRVKSLTTDEKLILQTMKSSTIVEVEGEKLRRRDDWKKWLIPPPTNTIQVYSESGSPSPSSTHNAIAASLQKMTVEDTPLSDPTTTSKKQSTSSSTYHG